MFGAVPTVIVAVSVGSFASGTSVKEIVVSLSICILLTVTLPVGTVTVSVVIGQDAVALSDVINPDPVISGKVPNPSIQVLGDMDVIVGDGQPMICAVVVAAGVPLTVTVAVSVVSPIGGATVAVICVLLTTDMFDNATIAPLGVVTVTVFTGQDEVALAVVVKPVPVMVTL